MLCASYRFFDTPFTLETDAASFLERFDRTYQRFRVVSAPDGPVFRVALTKEPTLSVGGDTISSTNREAMRQYAYNAVVNAVTGRVRSHFLFHGAALRTAGGRGVILAGDSGMGKTTLTLTLLQQGLNFLSDDVAAIGRADGQLYPFPRCPGVRFPGGRPGEKRLIDVESLAPGWDILEMKTGYPARFLFILGQAEEQDERACFLALDRAPAPLLADLRVLDGMGEVQIVRSEPYPAVQLDLEPGVLPVVEPKIQALCRWRQVLLFEIIRGRGTRPNFDREPELAPLSASEAAREFLRHLKGGPRSALLRHEFGGRAARLYLAAVSLTAGMDCYRLKVGRLDSMVQMITTILYREKD